jgi:hypothetical protein
MEANDSKNPRSPIPNGFQGVADEPEEKGEIEGTAAKTRKSASSCAVKRS